MGVSSRVPDMMAKWAREAADAKDVAAATAAIEQFNGRMKARLGIVAWPTIGAALISKHHWAKILCQSCDAVAVIDLRVKTREPAQPVCIVLSDTPCPRCNGHGRPALIGLVKTHDG